MIKTLTDAIHRHPGGTFSAFLALHAVVWTALPALFFLNLPLDLIEGLLYGREWQLGYDKLPPLPWWMLEATYRVFGPDLFFYALAQLVIIATFAVIWAMSRQLVGPVGALIAVLIIDGLHYYSFTSPKFNHDVIQLPFWALACSAYWAALRRGHLRHWLLLGFAIGMAAWAKYFVIVLAAPLVLFALFDRDARKVLVTPGPYIAAAVAAAVIFPHLVWLVQHDFLPFAYAEARAKPFTGLRDALVRPPWFLLEQLGALVPSLLIAAPYLRRRVEPAKPDGGVADAFDRRIVTMFAFGPAVFIFLLSLVSGRDLVAMWGYPLWLFLGLWIVMHATRADAVALWRISFLWGVAFIAYAAAFVVHFDVRPRLQNHYTAELFPGERLGAEASRRFRAMTGRPLSYVIADMWDGGNIEHYAPEHPRTLIDGNPKRAPWIDLGDLRARGAIVVWIETPNKNGMPPAFRAIAEDAEAQPPFTLPMRAGLGTRTFGWAVLRPRPVVARGSGG
jgi:4-amino-4-deoxy-L-arabinose transferase-like glycosyltransferase